MNKNILNNWGGTIIACLILGLAPYFPEPHIWGKLKWVAGGAVGAEDLAAGHPLAHFGRGLGLGLLC